MEKIKFQKSVAQMIQEARERAVERIKECIIKSDVHIKGKRGFRLSDEGIQYYLSNEDCYALFIDEEGELRFIENYDDVELKNGMNINFLGSDALVEIADAIEDLIANCDDSPYYTE